MSDVSPVYAIVSSDGHRLKPGALWSGAAAHAALADVRRCVPSVDWQLVLVGVIRSDFGQGIVTRMGGDNGVIVGFVAEGNRARSAKRMTPGELSS